MIICQTIKKRILNKLLIILWFLWLLIMLYFVITKQYYEIIKKLIIFVGSFIFGVIITNINKQK